MDPLVSHGSQYQEKRNTELNITGIHNFIIQLMFINFYNNVIT